MASIWFGDLNECVINVSAEVYKNNKAKKSKSLKKLLYSDALDELF